MIRSLLTAVVLIASILIAAPGACGAQEGSSTPVLLREKALGESLTKDAIHAIQIGVEWLEKSQQDDGCWSSPAFPAVTALAASAVLNSPDVLQSGETPEFIIRALDFIVSCAQDDGGIYRHVDGVKGGGLSNYNTAICLMALADARDPKYADTIARARAFLVRGQHHGQDPFDGGMGYDSGTNRPYADLSNTVFALEALRRTEPLEPPADGGGELDWDAAIAFVSRCQHLRSHNKAEWVSDDPAEQGGFVYHPQKSQAGAAESGDGEEEYLRSYGSMTYAGLLSFLHARVDKDDERVQAAVRWLARRWTLEENPGIGTDGLYYSYKVMAKALNAYGEDTLTLQNGKRVTWRPALVQKLVSLQRIDPATGLGYWRNDNNRWWENDPNLVTSYALLALESAVLDAAPSDAVVITTR